VFGCVCDVCFLLFDLLILFYFRSNSVDLDLCLFSGLVVLFDLVWPVYRLGLDVSLFACL